MFLPTTLVILFYFFVILLKWERSAVLIDSNSQLSNYGILSGRGSLLLHSAVG